VTSNTLPYGGVLQIPAPPGLKGPTLLQSPLGPKMLRTALSRRGIYPALRVGAHRYPYPQVRLASTASSQRPFLHRTRLLLRWTGYAAASTVVGVTLITGAIFVHDAFTYTEAHVDKVPVSPLALHPETGGPKNLPVVAAFLSDLEDPENERINEKPRLVIVGGGWGVGGTHTGVYRRTEETTIPSRPSGCYTNFPLETTMLRSFLQTRLQRSLPSSLARVHLGIFSKLSLTNPTAAAVGTVQVRSLVEPLRKIIARLEGHFISGKAVDLVMSERLLEVEVCGPDGSNKSIYVP
jgi:hypothetical protein